MPNVFQDPSKSLPKRDNQIIRVPLEEMDLMARKDHIPTPKQSPELGITHVPNAGGTNGAR
jgi:hypothetical protein